MSVKISDDSQADFKALVNLMKDAPEAGDEEGEERDDFDSDEDDRELLR